MPFKLESTTEYVEALVRGGFLTRTEANQMELQEKYLEDTLTPKEVMDMVPHRTYGGDRHKEFEALSEDAGLDPPPMPPTHVETMMNRAGVGSPINALFGMVTDAAGDAIGGAWDWVNSLGTDDEIVGGWETRADVIRTINDLGYNIDVGQVPGDISTMEELMVWIEQMTGAPPEVLDKVATEAHAAAIQREVDEKRIDEELDEDERLTEIATTNPDWVDNYRAYIKMDRKVPGKYRFDTETGAIYDISMNSYVDSSGRLLQDETAIRNAYGLDVNDPLPTLDQQAIEQQWTTPWDDMGITEEGYLSILDVVANKGGYGADPIRYLPGMDPFIGGFPSEYVVSRDDYTARELAMQDFLSGGTPDMALTDPNYFNDLSNRVLQETRRPWYDEYDNWALFAGMSSESIATVQRQLVEWGGLEEDEVVWGNWGPTEAAVMQQVMTTANGKGLQWTDERVAALMPGVFEEQTRASTPRAAFVPDPYRPMDPATVERTVTESIRQMLGRDPTEEDLAVLGNHLTETHSSAYAADVSAAKQAYTAQIAADEAGAQFGDAGVGPEQVDWESRYVLEMEKRFAPQLESQERQEKAAAQQDMGVAMSNLMSRLGGGLGG